MERAVRLVPRQVRRVVGFDGKGMVSLALWMARRRHGVPPGATAAPYSREQTSTLLLFLFVMVVELVGIEVLLRETGVPAAVRGAVFLIDAYSVLAVLAMLAACVTRPHVITDGELRVRYGAFFDLRIPRERIKRVRRVRSFNESGTVKEREGELAVAVASQTNLLVELVEPVTAVRPLGSLAEVGAVRFFADDPKAVLAALAAEAHQGSSLTPTVHP